MSRAVRIIPILAMACVVPLFSCQAAEQNHSVLVQKLQTELPKGSDTGTIERVFKEHHLTFSFDKFTNRYICNVRYQTAGEGTLIQLYIRNGGLYRMNAQDYTTAP